ncbi:MAG: amidohydrolase [Clostridiales bacterium]|jgi:imidazolonepropionase-like amidohydrolase|nr:amidohydrolase [Clostridiales bacterium]
MCKNLIIKNAKVLTMADEKPEYFYGSVVISDGKIERLTKDVPGDFPAVDAEGRLCMPGFVDGHCHVGMCDDSLGIEGDDVNDGLDPVMPHLRAIDGIYYRDRYFTEAVRSGVTAVVTGPGSANVLGGQFAALKTYGAYTDAMVIKAPVAIKAALGENPKNDGSKTPNTRMGTAALLREALESTIEYIRKKNEYAREPDDKDLPDYDIKLEALIPVLKGEIPLKIHAHRADDIVTAIRIKNEYNIKITLEHCTEGALVAELIKQNRIPVICGPVLSDRSKPELSNMEPETPAVLSKKGISVSLMTDHPETPVSFLPLCAMFAVKYGMDRYEALKAITINPAKACGIADKVGSIEPGKDADLIILDGDPLDFYTGICFTIINGEIVYGKNL